MYAYSQCHEDVDLGHHLSQVKRRAAQPHPERVTNSHALSMHTQSHLLRCERERQNELSTDLRDERQDGCVCAGHSNGLVRDFAAEDKMIQATPAYNRDSVRVGVMSLSRSTAAFQWHKSCMRCTTSFRRIELCGRVIYHSIISQLGVRRTFRMT